MIHHFCSRKCFFAPPGKRCQCKCKGKYHGKGRAHILSGIDKEGQIYWQPSIFDDFEPPAARSQESKELHGASPRPAQ